nr:hypothetical protein GCM10025699_19780 [Microbacterium flavescens]
MTSENYTGVITRTRTPRAGGYPGGERDDGFAIPFRRSRKLVRRSGAARCSGRPPAGRGEDENPLSWQTDALCSQTDPEAFFPEKGGSTRDAKRVCASCDVRGECLEYALQNDERFGIWGGLSERERRKLKRRA